MSFISLYAHEANRALNGQAQGGLVDLDVVDQIRKVAAKRHVPYQTLINQKLRELFMSEESLEDRVARIEEIVLKKRAGT